MIAPCACKFINQRLIGMGVMSRGSFMRQPNNARTKQSPAAKLAAINRACPISGITRFYPVLGLARRLAVLTRRRLLSGYNFHHVWPVPYPR